MIFSKFPVKVILLYFIFLNLVIVQNLVVQSTAANSIAYNHEALLVEALDKIKNNHIDEALTDLEYLIKTNPKFRLTQLVYADLLLSRTRPITDFWQSFLCAL